MVVKSHGPRRRTREKFRRTGRVPINRFIKQFNVGDRIVIDINSSSLEGMPFKRFQGLSGKIIEKRGRAYLVEIKDGNKLKTVMANPEHLKAM
jgi:large subunit ribosomal protein L21e